MTVIIPDPDLKDERGHNANYDFSIMGELSKRSIESIIFADRTLTNPPANPYSTVVPLFFSVTTIIRNGLKRVAGFVWRRPQQNPAFLASELSDRSEGPPAMLRSIRSLAGSLASFVQPLNEFGHLWRLSTQVTPRIRPGDLVLISVYSPLVLLTRAVWLHFLRWRRTRTRVVILLHTNAGPELLFRVEMKIMTKLASFHHLVYVAHTQPLVEYCREKSGASFVELPYPFSFTEGASVIAPFESEKRPPVFAYLGSASVRRGFDLLVDAIELLRDLLDNGRLILKVQAYQWTSNDGPRGASAFRQLEKYAEEIPGLELISRALSMQRYYGEMRNADVIVAPHRPEYFPMARSGVFSEALSLGKPVIVSRGTYMAKELGQHGAGVVFDNCDAASLAAAIREAVERIGPLRAQAAVARSRWLELQNPARFIDELLCLAGEG